MATKTQLELAKEILVIVAPRLYNSSSSVAFGKNSEKQAMLRIEVDRQAWETFAKVACNLPGEGLQSLDNGPVDGIDESLFEDEKDISSISSLGEDEKDISNLRKDDPFTDALDALDELDELAMRNPELASAVTKAKAAMVEDEALSKNKDDLRRSELRYLAARAEARKEDAQTHLHLKQREAERTTVELQMATKACEAADANDAAVKLLLLQLKQLKKVAF